MKQLLYDDGLVTLDANSLTIHRYYFPLGTGKRIAYSSIKGVQEISIGFWTGKGRLWGSGSRLETLLFYSFAFSLHSGLMIFNFLIW